LAAFWPGLQVLAGDIEAAIQSHMTYANLWARFVIPPLTPPIPHQLPFLLL
jgi:hypothetical protein